MTNEPSANKRRFLLPTMGVFVLIYSFARLEAFSEAFGACNAAVGVIGIGLVLGLCSILSLAPFASSMWNRSDEGPIHTPIISNAVSFVIWGAVGVMNAVDLPMKSLFYYSPLLLFNLATILFLRREMLQKP